MNWEKTERYRPEEPFHHMYIPYQQVNLNVLGQELDCVCNGCGFITVDWKMPKHIQECTISQMRIKLDKKSNRKAKFTDVRE